MGKGIIVVVLLAVICIALSDEAHARKKISRESHNIKEIDLKLKLLNKPAVKSIKSSDGDIIDCVDIYKQPALDHPALRNHTIQLKPSFHIVAEETTPRNKNDSFSSSSSKRFELQQTWQKNGTCPQGTIPIRRVQRQDLLRAKSLNHFGRKNPINLRKSINDTDDIHKMVLVNDTAQNNFEDDRSRAYLYTAGYNYIGAQGDINIWNPHVEDKEYTTAQIWLKQGPSTTFESVETGWTVNPVVYGDKKTRFFVHWTRDGYTKTGCFDLLCQGFVHTNPKMALGAALEPWSSESGRQYQFTAGLYLDVFSGNWWVKLTNNVVVGYFPGKLFDYLSHSAIFVQWGGEVYSPNVKKKKPHTRTGMGSGEAASLLEGTACYIKEVRIIDYSTSLKYPERVGSHADEPYCYSAYNYIKGYKAEPVFFFGGSAGRNQFCP